VPNLRSLVRMSDTEVTSFLERHRALTMCTYQHDGTIHAVAMWYGLRDGRVAIAAKRKSQKVVNLLRDDRITVLIDDGTEYHELQGVELVGRVELLDNEDDLFSFGVHMAERRNEAWTAARVRSDMHNRVVAVVHPDRVVSWDHRKLPR
jgi:PPOX class probable F420-dependent enzyme